MKKCVTALLAAGLFVLGSWAQADSWKDKIRTDHPRLFINKESIPAIKKMAGTVRKAEFEALKKEVDALPEKPELEWNKERFKLDGDGKVVYITHSEGLHLVKTVGGHEALKCALMYVLTDDPKYKDKAFNYLKMAVGFFEWCFAHRTLVDWHSELRQNAITAYDWIYNGLTPEQRREIIVPLLENIRNVNSNVKYHRNAGGGATTGNYGVSNLQLFAGLAACKDGFADALAEKLLDKAYDNNLKMLEYREKISDGSGLLVAPTAGYSFGMYPYATFIFFHLMKSATGEDVSEKYPQMLDYPNWFDWATIPVDGSFLQYGIGDTAHTDNRIGVGGMYTHLAQTIHFYGRKHPEKMAPVYATLKLIPERLRTLNRTYPMLPFILTNFDPGLVEKADLASLSGKAKAARFPAFGLLVMRSGAKADDTHALFRFGSKYGHHSHFDENAFIIFRKNFLALDSGSRCQNMHHVHYAPQTVAHNAILIHMPKEKQAPFWRPWGSTAEVSDEVVDNHGGQYITQGGKELGFESNAHYTYAAGDAAPTYRAEKCKEAVRQFVYLYPDFFVVYDRVESVKPDQQKEWLLHTQNRPVQQPDGSWMADHEGRLFWKTLLPAKPAVKLVGGPGREFEASGKNWPLPGKNPANVYKLAGNWRMEVAEPQPGVRSRFLHVLEAALPNKAAMIPSKAFSDAKSDGVELTTPDGTRWVLKFNREGAVGGHIKATGKDGKVLVDKAFDQAKSK